MSQYLTYQDQTISVGDTVKIHQRILEEKKTRIQMFEGVVIAIRGKGTMISHEQNTSWELRPS